jgi:hypothetical protein
MPATKLKHLLHRRLRRARRRQCQTPDLILLDYILPDMKGDEVSRNKLTVLERYDVAADAKKRINLRNAKTKYFHVKALSNGCYVLEPRVLVSPDMISVRSLKMLDKSAANLKKGLASAPIDLSAFLKT